MRLTSFLRPHGEHIKLLSFILYLYPSYFSFSLLYFYRASGFLSPFARRKYHKVCIQFSLYLPYFLTLLIKPHAADFLSPAAWGTHIKLLTSISNSLIQKSAAMFSFGCGLCYMLFYCSSGASKSASHSVRMR